MMHHLEAPLPSRACGRVATALIIVALSALSGLGWAAESPQAVLVQLTGKATVADRLGVPRPAHAPLRLLAGERLTLHPGSRGIVMYPDRSAQTLLADGQQRSILIQAASSRRSTSSLGQVWGFLLNRLFARRDAEEVNIASRPIAEVSGPVRPLRPANGRELCRPLTLSWSSGKPGTSYTPVIYDAGKEIWRKAGVLATQLPYPVDALELLPGHRYEWGVISELGRARVESDRVWFELVDQAEVRRMADRLGASGRNELPMDPLACHIARTTLLAAAGLADEAASEAAEARRLRPDDDDLRQVLDALVSPRPEESQADTSPRD
jgi:hypothetical protein